MLSLPKPDLFPLAWVALVPLLFATAYATAARQVFIASYTAGLAFFVGGFYWITETMMIYGGLSAPLAAGSTTYPSSRRTRPTRARTDGSSSTSKIVFGATASGGRFVKVFIASPPGWPPAGGSPGRRS